MSTLKVNRIEPRTGDTVEIIGLEFPPNQPLPPSIIEGLENTTVAVYQEMATEIALPKNTYVKQTYGTIANDQNDEWDPVDNSYSPKQEGEYMVIAVCKFTGVTQDNSHTFCVFKNGNQYSTVETNMEYSGGHPTVSIQTVIPMNGTTDKIEVYLRNGASGTVHTFNGFDSTTSLNRAFFVRLT